MKPIEFTADKPLVVLVKQTISGDWTIEPRDDMKPKMIKRVDDDLIPAGIAGEWTARRKPNAPTQPHFLRHRDHIPFVVREGEFMRFECDPASTFSISVDPDPDVFRIPNALSNPFGWASAILRTPGIYIQDQVLGPVLGIGPRDQRFFKASSWIVGVATVHVDPDGICDR